MATQPSKWPVQIGINSNQASIPVTAGVDQIDLTKLYPSSYELPLDAGGNAVGRTEMNALFSTLAENIYFMQQGGVYIYASTINYTVGTRVLYNGDIYKCKQANGPASKVASPTNTTYWDRFVLSSDLSHLNFVPSGVFFPYGGIAAPAGYLLCDGAAYSRKAYPTLFAAIGTRYGAGDGNTTFNVPKLNDGSFVRGVATRAVGTKYSASLPPLTARSNGDHTHTKGTMRITGSLSSNSESNEPLFLEEPALITASGALLPMHERTYPNTGLAASAPGTATIKFDTNLGGWSGVTSSNGTHTHTIDNSAGVAMNGNTVLPQSVGVNYIIKI